MKRIIKKTVGEAYLKKIIKEMVYETIAQKNNIICESQETINRLNREELIKIATYFAEFLKNSDPIPYEEASECFYSLEPDDNNNILFELSFIPEKEYYDVDVCYGPDTCRYDRYAQVTGVGYIKDYMCYRYDEDDEHLITITDNDWRILFKYMNELLKDYKWKSLQGTEKLYCDYDWFED